MSDALNAVSSISLRQSSKEDVGLVAVSSKSLKETDKRDDERVLSKSSRKDANTPANLSTPGEALQILKSRPDEAQLLAVLEWIVRSPSDDFDIHLPGPESSNILRHLVTVTVPDFWTTSEACHGPLIRCLRSGFGLAALVSQIRSSTERLQRASGPTTSGAGVRGKEHVELLQTILQDEAFIWQIWTSCGRVRSESRRRLIWADFVSLLASGKLVSTVAQSEDSIRSSESKQRTPSWLAEGAKYTASLAASVAHMLIQSSPDDTAAWKASTDLVSKLYSLGYTETLIGTVLRRCLDTQDLRALKRLIKDLRPMDQKRILPHLLRSIESLVYDRDQDKMVRQYSAVLSRCIQENDAIQVELAAWLSNPTRSCSLSRAARRGAVATLRTNVQFLQTVFEECLKLLGEAMFIRQRPAIEQQACAEVVMLSAGALNAQQPTTFRSLARSSVFSSMVSSRLDSSAGRSRILGMCVGMAISGLIDKPENRLQFDVAEVKTEEATSLLGLVGKNDSPGTLEEFLSSRATKTSPEKTRRDHLPGKSVQPATENLSNSSRILRAQIIGPRISEVVDDDDESSSTVSKLKAYPKPDSDPEDSDDDPTLINRDKAKAPVYIRDLIAGLRDQEKHDRHKLALEQAALLLRRKANFGKEIDDHAEELCAVLVGLQDYFELEDFVELRLQALIALLLSNPAELGPLFASQAFEGDFSLAQRGSVLSALGLGARELAGYQDTASHNSVPTAKDAFPSKRLPDKYHRIYTNESPGPRGRLLPSQLNAVTSSLTSSIIAPLAASAADSATGPAILKTRTFSSRLKSDPESRTRRIPNELSKLLYTSFFTPLLGHFHTHTATLTARARGVFLEPHFLSTYLKTLGVLVQASGPGTVRLPDLTDEFWGLLLSLRTKAKEDAAVMEAVLFGLLVLLEVNEDTRRLARECGRQVVETREWVNDVFRRLGKGDDEEEVRLGGLVAGVMVKCGEVMEKWERLMVGDVMRY